MALSLVGDDEVPNPAEEAPEPILGCVEHHLLQFSTLNLAGPTFERGPAPQQQNYARNKW